MVTILRTPERTFSEYSLLTDYTPKGCGIRDVGLDTKIAGMKLSIPLFSAAMGSVSGREMVFSLAKEGGLGVLPVRMALDEAVQIIADVKSYETGFVEDPLRTDHNATIEETFSRIRRYGHTNIPVVDNTGVFLGMFDVNRYKENPTNPRDLVTTAMIPASHLNTVSNADIDLRDAQSQLGEHTYLVVLDDDGRLQKMAFQKDMETLPIGGSISTREGWDARADAMVKAGADIISIDTSDAHSEYAVEVIHSFKYAHRNIPLCAGNVITYRGAMDLMRAGADVIKGGMSSGSICTTAREKAVGRAPMAVLFDLMKARDDYQRESGRYVPIVMDGGIKNSADMVIALTIADAVMVGGYLNHFLEAAGPKLNENGQETRIEREMRRVMTWGEGSDYAQNLERYGQTQSTFFAEGVVGTVPYEGRLKPNVKDDMNKVCAALSNVGTDNLQDYRDRATIALLSPAAQGIVMDSHDVQVGRGQ